MARKAVIIAGGDPAPLAFLQQRIDPEAWLLAADRGAAYALEAGLIPQEVIGDFDSLPDVAAGLLQQHGVTRTHYRPDKDASDLELALRRALSEPVSSIEIFCALGGRVDHLMTNALVLLAARRQNVPCRIVSPSTDLFFLLDRADITGAPGDWLTLLAISERVEDIWTEGLRYSLHGETLVRGSSRGLSNELIASLATVRAGRGDLLAIHTRPEVV